MRSETPLWEKVYMGRWSRTYINTGKIIGHLGCGAFAFFDAAKLLPDYDQHRYAKREQGQYELHSTAKKILRIIIGPRRTTRSMRSGGGGGSSPSSR
jgi:hypothetical protein